jgi:hypothetical protein
MHNSDAFNKATRKQVSHFRPGIVLCLAEENRRFKLCANVGRKKNLFFRVGEYAVDAIYARRTFQPRIISLWRMRISTFRLCASLETGQLVR